MFTYEQIKNIYYYELVLGIESRGFDDYLKDNFVQTYDKQLNFIGYERA